MKSVILLIGPKGSGKTSIGKSVAKQMGIRFLDVEKLLIDYIREHSIKDNNLPNHGFDIEEQEIKSILGREDAVIAEATGSSEYFLTYYKKLKSQYRVVPIKITCPYEKCLERIRTRSNENNFEVSEVLIKSIFKKNKSLKLDWVLTIDNSSRFDIEEICSEINCHMFKQNA